MRPIEFTLNILTILSGLLYLFPKTAQSIKYRLVPAVLILAGVAQLGLEGFRWQLWPLYLAVLLLLVTAGIKLRGQDFSSRPGGLAGGAFFLAMLSLAAGWLLPIPKPYPISGPYEVGTTVFPLTDPSRKEIYAADPNAPREVMVQIWYPADPSGDARQSLWMPDIVDAGPAVAKWINLPSFSLNHLQYVKANAFVDAPLLPASQKFPLLIFSHGWSGFKEQNVYQVEELASQGYVVAAINHTYGAVMTVFPDGRKMMRNDAALPDGVSEEAYDRASNRLVRQWAEDIAFLLDELERRDRANEEWLLSDRLEFSKVGVFGHSTGGGATAEFCGTDARCQAALAMDLWVEPVSATVIDTGLSQPLLLMHSAAWVNPDEPSPNFSEVGELLQASSGDVIEFRIEGTMHHDFSSLPLLTPLASSIGLKGPISGNRVLQLINSYTVAFFDQYLLGIDQEILEPQKSPYAEVQFDLRP